MMRGRGCENACVCGRVQERDRTRYITETGSGGAKQRGMILDGPIRTHMFVYRFNERGYVCKYVSTYADICA